uniref:Transposase n=1 Tax=Staphylococcus aureus TaxID=1280 RepID=M1XIQ2_STAAU|nr:transposase [Staphylococcus aureus]
MKRVSYSVETKYKAVEMKAAGFSTKEIMKELNIKNRTQVETWWRWYRNGEKIEHKWKLGGDGIEMGKVIDFHNTLVNNIPTVKD